MFDLVGLFFFSTTSPMTTVTMTTGIITDHMIGIGEMTVVTKEATVAMTTETVTVVTKTTGNSYHKFHHPLMPQEF